ncbi:hypothetical protein MHBO_000998 [Bonamia ostreae]|uniref:Uncharacterized protein n=1 Tax=Bonamia ostreae TaxID=126728 RepID=A0ABV2AI18_9EUKA
MPKTVLTALAQNLLKRPKANLKSACSKRPFTAKFENDLSRMNANSFSATKINKRLSFLIQKFAQNNETATSNSSLKSIGFQVQNLNYDRKRHQIDLVWDNDPRTAAKAAKKIVAAAKPRLSNFVGNNMSFFRTPALKMTHKSDEKLGGFNKQNFECLMNGFAKELNKESRKAETEDNE